MATYTAVTGGGNWNNTATWGGAGYPQAGDTAILPATMTGTITVNVTSTCATLTVSRAGALMAMNANLTITTGMSFGVGCGLNLSGTYNLIDAGTFTIAKTPSFTSTSTATFVITGTMSLPIVTFNVNVQFNTAGTVTLSGNYTFNKVLTKTAVTFAGSGTFTMTNGSTIYSVGSAYAPLVYFTGTVALGDDFVGNSLFGSGTHTITGAYNMSVSSWGFQQTSTTTATGTYPSGQTITVSSNLYLQSPQANSLSIVASSAGNSFNVIYGGTMANIKVHRIAFTDIDASGGGRIYNYFGTGTRVNNIVQVRNSDIGCVGVALKTINKKRTFYV